MTSSRRLAIATPQKSATEAARDAFGRGGNAFDACLAAALSLAVVYPDNCTLGGDMIAVVGRADGSRVVINASGPAAAGVDLGALRRGGTRMPLSGVEPITVPGLVAGLHELWGCGARLGWEDAFAAAIRQAREGIPVVPSLAHSFEIAGDALYEDPGCRQVFFQGSEPLRMGDRLRQPALAATLETLATEGPSALYGGPLGRELIDGLRGLGSVLELGDLQRFVPELVPPHVRQLGDREIVTAPPNSQGFLLPLILDAALRLDPRLDPLGPEAGPLALALRASLSVRERYLADPIAIAPERLEEMMGIDLLSWETSPSAGMPPADGDTVAIVVADDAGNSISLLQSLFHRFGARVLEPETGILLHNRGAHFSLDQSSPNVIAPGKRPAHTLTPCTVFNGGRAEAVIATMGGSVQPQILAEVLLRLWRGEDPGAALEAPRWVVGGLGAEDSFDQILVEEGVPAAARHSLEEVGMQIRPIPDLDGHAGHTQLVVRGQDGRLLAASDPRSEGAALVADD